MSEDLNLEELIEDLDLDEVIFTQRTERSDNGIVACSLNFSVSDPRCDPYSSDENPREIEFKITKQKSVKNGADIIEVNINDIKINKDSHPILVEKLIQKMKESSLKRTEKGMGNVLASACIVTEQTQPSFSSRIGWEKVFEESVFYKTKELIKVESKLSEGIQLEINNSHPDSALGLKLSYINSKKDIKWEQLKEEKREYKGFYSKINKDDTLKKDIFNAVKSARSSNPPKSIATIMVSCRYSDFSAIDGGHTICIAVNTNKFKFDENGKLLNDTKLTPEDCAIIDSSGAIVDTIQNNLSHDNGIAEISLQLNQLIDVSNIKTYSLYPKSIQVGPKCSDYARRAYQELSSGRYTDIVDLKNRSFEFANSIHGSVEKDYERVFEGENQALGNIKKELNEKAPKKNNYVRQTMQHSPLNSNVAQQLAAKNITKARGKQPKSRVCNLI